MTSARRRAITPLMFELDQQDDVARLTLSRPRSRNAIPIQEWPRLAVLIEQAGVSGAKLLVVEGAGGAFCAGADLDDFAALEADEPGCGRFRVDMRDAIDTLAALPIPTLAWIDGPCFGAGVALALACDLRLGSSAARFAITPAKIGIAFPQEDVQRLVAAVGAGQAARLLFTAATISADEACRIGLVEQIADAAERETLIATIAGFPAESERALKRSIALARTGTRSDRDSDRAFDRLLASSATAELLRKARAR
jgi:enoyl-CoA hydratase/carnithine racemase